MLAVENNERYEPCYRCDPDNFPLHVDASSIVSHDCHTMPPTDTCCGHI